MFEKMGYYTIIKVNVNRSNLISNKKDKIYYDHTGKDEDSNRFSAI